MQTVGIWKGEHKFESLLYASSCELRFTDIFLFHTMMLWAKFYYAILQMDKLKFTKGNERYYTQLIRMSWEHSSCQEPTV